MISANLSAARERHGADLEAVERLLVAALDSREDALRHVGGHLLASGGKRLRPLLCLLAAEACGVPAERAVVLGATVELTHAASLCHDDVLDGGEVRRGKATVRARFGDAMSILLGDLCLVRAFTLLARHGLDTAAESLGQAITAMAEGEVRQATVLTRTGASVEDYLAVAEAKTGALLSWCATLGGHAPEASRAALEAYACSLGRVYQMADDLLDLDQQGNTGKTAGQDLSSGRPSLPILLAARSDDDLGQRLRRALEDAGAGDLDELAAALRSSDAMGRVRGLVTGEVEQAIAALEVLPSSPAREALVALVQYAAQRDA